MADEGGVDERRDWVGGEGEHGGRGDADDIRRNPINPEPPQHPTKRTGLRLFVILPLSLWSPRCRRLHDVCDGRLPFTAASRGSPPRSSAAGEAAAAGKETRFGPGHRARIGAVDGEVAAMVTVVWGSGDASVIGLD
jgi:hypothetical protein